jgi:hypothetical protein
MRSRSSHGNPIQSTVASPIRKTIFENDAKCQIQVIRIFRPRRNNYDGIS